MPRAMRLLVTCECNLACPYCCNNLPEVVRRFSSTSLAELPGLIEQHGDVCITGGEPLIDDETAEGVLDIISLVKSTPGDRKVYLYTNGTLVRRSLYYTSMLNMLVDGVTIGLHDWLGPDQIRKIQRDCYVAFGDKAFYRIQQGSEHMMEIGFRYETWRMNECLTDEDIYVLEEGSRA